MEISPLFQSFQREEIAKNACIKVYPNCYKLTVFDRPIFSDGYEPQKGTKKRTFCRSERAETRSDSARRAKTAIFDISALNDWDFFVTLTLDAEKVDRFEAKQVLKPFSKWLQNMVQRRSLRYLIVPEHHADGAIHFHGLVKGELRMVDSGTMRFPGRKKPIKIATAKKLKLNIAEGQTVYNIEDYKLGFSSAIPTFGERENLAKYMTKYITKDLCKIFGSFYFAGGRDLVRKPPRVDLNLNFEKIEAPMYCGDYGNVKYLSIPRDFKLLSDSLSLWIDEVSDLLTRGKVWTLFGGHRKAVL